MRDDPIDCGRGPASPSRRPNCAALIFAAIAAGLALSGPIDAAAAQQAPEATVRLDPSALAAENPEKGRLPVPDEDIRVVLVQSVLAALNHANLTGDNDVLFKLMAPTFQQANPPEKLAETFRSFREGGNDLSPSVLFRATLAHSPSDSRRSAPPSGAVPSRPMEVSSEMDFLLDGSGWRLFGLNVALSQPVPTSAGPLPDAVAPRGAWGGNSAPVGDLYTAGLHAL